MESLRKQNVKQFSDIDLDFIPHPATGDIIPLTDADSVKRSIRNLLFTGLYERPFNPNLGANLKQLLFEPVSPISEVSIRTLIVDVIRLYEPRVTVVDLQVSVTPDELGYDVYLLFSIDNVSEITAVNIFLERLR